MKKKINIYQCNQLECYYKCKSKTDMKKHKQNRHNIGVVWKYCFICNFKTKQTSSLNTHKANKHGIGRKLFKCDICDYTCKQKNNRKEL